MACCGGRDHEDSLVECDCGGSAAPTGLRSLWGGFPRTAPRGFAADLSWAILGRSLRELGWWMISHPTGCFINGRVGVSFVPQGLKRLVFLPLPARDPPAGWVPRSCPDTKPVYETRCSDKSRDAARVGRPAALLGGLPAFENAAAQQFPLGAGGHVALHAGQQAVVADVSLDMKPHVRPAVKLVFDKDDHRFG